MSARNNFRKKMQINILRWGNVKTRIRKKSKRIKRNKNKIKSKRKNVNNLSRIEVLDEGKHRI